MRRIEESVCLSRLRGRTLETCVLCAGLASCALAIPSPLAGASVSVVSLGVAKGAGVTLRDYLRLLFAASSFALVSIVPLSVSLRTAPLALSFDPDGFHAGVMAGSRAVGTLSATLLLAFTTPFPRMLSLLRWMRVPSSVTDLLALVHRQIFLLDETFSRLRMALASRGGWNGIKAGLHTLSMGMAALFVQALDHSRRLEAGLASRGAENGDVRFWDDPIVVRPAMLALAILLPAALAVVVALERGHLGI